MIAEYVYKSFDVRMAMVPANTQISMLTMLPIYVREINELVRIIKFGNVL